MRVLDRINRYVTGATDPAAERHTFSSGGLLGHDLTASPWLVNVSEQTALALDVVQDCVQIIGDAVAGSEIAQWNGTTRVDPPSGFTLRPDPDMTRRDFVWQFAANLALYRAVYLEEARVGGQTLGVRLHCTANVMRQGGDYYIAGQRVTNPMRLVRLSVWPTLDIDMGSTIMLAREVFAGAMAANAYTSDYWQQGGAPVYYIKTDQEISATQAGAIGDAWVDSRTTNVGRPPVIGKGATVLGLSADLAASGATSSSDKLHASIARYFKMLPEMVNVPSESGPLHYTTEEQIAIRLVRYTIQPYCDVIGEALSAYLPGDYLLGDVIKLNPNNLLRADQQSRFTAWATALGTAPGQTGQGWMTAAEVRAEEGLPPDDSIVIESTLNQGVANVGA